LAGKYSSFYFSGHTYNFNLTYIFVTVYKAHLKKCIFNIARYFFLILFLGFFGSNTFFDHTHIYDGNIIVHSHPYKHDLDGKPINGHNDSNYLLIYLLNNFLVPLGLALTLISIILVLYWEIIGRAINNQISRLCKSSFLLRGPPCLMLS